VSTADAQHRPGRDRTETDRRTRSTRRRLAGALAAIGLAAGLAACGGGSTVNTGSGGSSASGSASTPASSGSSGSGTSTAAGGTAKTVGGKGGKGTWTLGGIVDLTGTDASGGPEQEKGDAYILDQINRAGGINGHKLQIKFCDGQTTPQGAAQCAQQLAGVNSHLVLVQGADPPTRGALPSLTKDLVVAIDPILLPKAGTNAFQATSSGFVVAGALVGAAKAAGMKTIGVLYTTDTSGTHQLAAAQMVAKQAGIKVVSEAQDPSSTDVTPQLIKLRSAGAQVIYLASVGTNTAAAVNSYKTLNMSQPVVVGAAAVTNGFLSSLSSIPQHMFGVSELLGDTSKLPPATAKAFKTYLANFKAKEGSNPDTQTTSGAYGACLAAAALKGGGADPTQASMEKFLKTGTITCLGSAEKFTLPGLNVVNGQPAGLSEAGASAADGWGTPKGGL
jgi:branched-chain amino acid transport system substrate-binding protein